MALLNGSWFQFLSGSWGSSSSWAATTACRGVKQKTRHVTDMFERSGYFRHFRHIFNLFCYSFVILYFLIYFDNCRYWYWIIRKSEVQSCVVYCNIVMHCREKRRLPDLSGVRNEVRNGIFNPWISSVKQIHCVLSCVIPRPFIIFHHLSSSFIIFHPPTMAPTPPTPTIRSSGILAAVLHLLHFHPFPATYALFAIFAIFAMS